MFLELGHLRVDDVVDGLLLEGVVFVLLRRCRLAPDGVM